VIAFIVALIFAQKDLPFSSGGALDHLECFCGEQSVTLGELEESVWVQCQKKRVPIDGFWKWEISYRAM
jgi:hypothetical protein